MSWITTILDRIRRNSTPNLRVDPSYEELWAKEPESKSPEEWGLGDVEVLIPFGEKSLRVHNLQLWLISLGFPLPRFGDDGSLGDETISAVVDYQAAREKEGFPLKTQENALKIRGVGKSTYQDIANKIHNQPPKLDPPIPNPTSFGKFTYLVKEDEGGKKAIRPRSWADITGITLHQTATIFGENPQKFRSISAHLGISRGGHIILINGLNFVVYHGNAFNSHDVGIEVDGHFEGVEGDLMTYWKPKSNPTRQPLRPTEEQIQSTRKAIAWIIERVKFHGGEVKWIHAHRQSSKFRTSDPGSHIWKEVGLWAKKEFGLQDGGPDFTAGGYPIPKEWDPSYTTRYRPW